MTQKDSRQLNAAVELLLYRVPEFAKARADEDSFMSQGKDDVPYLVFGDFGLFLVQHLKGSSARAKWFQSAFQLINEMITSPDPQIANLIHVGVLEVLSDHPEAFMLAKGYLSPSAQSEVEKWARKF